jgi:hypothetical protein
MHNAYMHTWNMPGLDSEQIEKRTDASGTPSSNINRSMQHQQPNSTPATSRAETTVTDDGRALFLSIFARQCTEQPNAVAYSWTDDNGREVQTLTFRQVCWCWCFFVCMMADLVALKCMHVFI